MIRTSKNLRNCARILACLAVSATASSCSQGIDTTRDPRQQATFGDDLYSVLCDRVGAEVFQEDVTGQSYKPVCHFDATGAYGDTVDLSFLPPPQGDASQEARRIAIAKMEALARHRSDLVRAFNATFPDVDIDNIVTPQDGDTIRLHDALMALGQNMVPLYDADPFDPTAEPLTPATTRAMGRLFDSMAHDQDALGTLAQIWGRKGYRPFGVGLGAIRATLAYPGLRDFTVSTIGVLGPAGNAAPQLQELLSVGEQEMLHARAEVSMLPDLVFDDTTGQLNRPRSDIEMVRDLLLYQSDAFADSAATPKRYISLRDRRGFVIPAGNSPGVKGTVPAPFADTNQDGYADVDASGRFVDGSGQPLDLATPFVIPGVDSGTADQYGRPDAALYTYVDTSRTLAAGLVKQLAPLLDATEIADPGDPNAYQKESETVMYALAGAYDLFGGREDVEYDYDKDQVVPLGTGCASCKKFSRFKGEESPLPVLAHAAGQILADPDSDVMLLGMIDLLENHEQEVARLVGAALRLKQIADDHDAAAAAGQVPPASLPYENPVWDEIAQVMSRIASKEAAGNGYGGGLVAHLLGAMADDTVVTPIGGAQNMGDAISAFAGLRDEMNYNPYDVNGPCANVTLGGQSISDPVTAVDWNGARSGKNRSMMERALLLIHDARGAVACNKQGAVVKAHLFGITLDWPLSGSYNECELFQINDLAAFYLDSLLDPSHPKRAMLNIKSSTLNSIMAALGGLGQSPDTMFEQSSGITGMTLHPTPQALNRLVWFGATSDAWPAMPDFDAINQGSRTDNFVHALIEPVSSAVCPVNGNGVQTCTVQDDLLRMRDRNSIFTWERFGFYDYLAPMLTAFVNSGCSADGSFCDTNDTTAENLFIDLVNVFYRHYPGMDHGPECNTQGNAQTNPKYCSGAGINRYEPIIQKGMKSDLIPALHEFAKAAYSLSKVTIQRGPKKGQTLTGAEILELTTKVLFSQDYAAQVQMKDFHGKTGATWTDGTAQKQVTPFNMFADALHGFDAAFAANGDDGAQRQKMWKRARSQLVDAFMAVDGDGTNAHFRSKATTPILLATLKLVRQQLNANCPNRENGVECTWAKVDFGKKLSDTISSPLFASMVDLTESIRQDDSARRATERYLQYLLQSANDGDTLQATLASMVDVMQVLSDDAKLTPIIQAAAVASKPRSDSEPGCADRTVRALKALTNDKYDPYHVLDPVLRNLVTPIDDGAGPALSPIEIMMDTIADVDRQDPSVADPLAPSDYGLIMGAVRDFMTDENRGLEQFYAIIQKRQRK